MITMGVGMAAADMEDMAEAMITQAMEVTVATVVNKLFLSFVLFTRIPVNC